MLKSLAKHAQHAEMPMCHGPPPKKHPAEEAIAHQEVPFVDFEREGQGERVNRVQKESRRGEGELFSTQKPCSPDLFKPRLRASAYLASWTPWELDT